MGSSDVIARYFDELNSHALRQGTAPVTAVWLARHVIFDMPTPIISALLKAYDVKVDKAAFDVPATDAPAESKAVSQDAFAIIGRAYALARSRGEKLRVIDPADVLINLTMHPTSAPILEGLGLTKLKITYFLSHGRALPATREEELEHLKERSGEAFVAIRNDDFTEMDLVMRVLGEVFAFDAEGAKMAMLAIHQHGATFIGPYTYEDAHQRAASVIAMARESGAPLRASLARDNTVSFAEMVAEEKRRLSRRISAVQGRPVGFIVRHWRGQWSFPKSFLIIGVPGTVALAAGWANAMNQAAMHLETPAFIAAAALIALFVILTFTWQWTGVWRSAHGYKTTKWRTRVATLVQGAMVVGAAASFTASIWAFPNLESFASVFIDAQRIPRYSVSLEGRHTVVFSGGFRFGASRALKRALDENLDVTIVRLESPGGLASEGALMRLVIEEHDLVTHVRGTCASACTSAFLGGSERYLSPEGRLIFHRSRHGVQAGARESSDSAARHLRRSGIPQSFIDRVAITPAASGWAPGHRELIEAGVVHRIGEPIVAQSATSPDRKSSAATPASH